MLTNMILEKTLLVELFYLKLLVVRLKILKIAS